MNPFLREHARPLIGSALLHAAVAAGAVAAAWFSVAPRIAPPQAIEGYLASAPRAHAGAVPAAAPDPAPPPEVPVTSDAAPPDPALVAREHEAELAQVQAVKAAQARRIEKAAEVKAAEVKAAEVKAAEATAADAKAKAKAAEAKAAAETARHKTAERDAKHKADADARRKADLEAKVAQQRKAADEARAHQAAAREKARVAAENRTRELREADLARQLADEQHRIGAQAAGLEARYKADLSASINRAWNRPPTAKAGIRCIVDVSQVPGGTVTDVRVGECNGDAAVVESIKGAVFRASPLPSPPDASLFQSKLHLVFNPDG